MTLPIRLEESSVAHLLRLAAAVPSLPVDPDFPDGDWLGEYELLRPIGSGGMGRVYEACRTFGEQSVALKVLHPTLVNERDRRRFLDTAEQVAALKHENIVSVLHVVSTVPRPYFTMDLVEGQPLRPIAHEPVTSETWQRKRPRLLSVTLPRAQRELSRVMGKVAAAVEHAHKHGLLHRDLKPANILLDALGEPRIVDFGLAQRLVGREDSAIVNAPEGTPAYMPPEQVRGGAAGLAVEADVYALGATLYELLTGRPPYEGSNEDIIAQITSDEKVTAPRELEPAVHPYLEAVCLRCLDKEPSRRYSSAAALADDLFSLGEGRPPNIPPRSRWMRLVYNMRRHPGRTRRAVGGLILTLLCASAMFWAWSSRQQSIRSAALSNTAIASGQAGAALLQLDRYAKRITEAAADEKFIAMASEQAQKLDPGREFKELSRGLDAIYLVSRTGYLKAQWPLPELDLWDRSYSFRDYFRGAEELALTDRHGAYVAPAYLSERDQQLKFAVSAPMYSEGRWVGVLVGALATDSVFGVVKTGNADPNRTTALLGPRGIDRKEADLGDHSLPERFVVLIHDGLERGKEFPVVPAPQLRAAFGHTDPPGRQLELVLPPPQVAMDYRDSVPGFGGRWMASFAPVGKTGYVIVAQSRAPDF